MATKKTTGGTLTRAAKTDAAKKIILQILETSSLKSNELIDTAANVYAEQFESKDNPNDIRGRIGSVLDVMKKDGEVAFEGGMYALKSAPMPEQQEEKPKKRGRKPKAETAEKTEEKQEKPKKTVKKTTKTTATKKTKTAGEKLQEVYLDKLHKLGGEYFEYYAVYLLERYSRKNGRRLEGLKMSGGEHDGGIDGEIELTDKLGFRETIYIQAKNWDADKGNKKLWVVGETLLQQFLGACMCRQAKDGKPNCRGIFITTSRFTPEAKALLDVMSDKIIGYDGAELFETAKECQFGVVEKDGEWRLDEDLLSGMSAFYRNF